LAHYCGTQYGAKRLYTLDGKVGLRDHCLLRVTKLAMDGVRLTGAHPTEIEGKYVDITLQEWTTMFKLVNETDPSLMAKRARLAASKHAEMKLQKLVIHPDCFMIAAMHIEATSSRNNKRTNAVFDVRGDAVIIGDVMLGLCWPEEPATTMLSVTRKQLTGTEWFVQQDAAANHFDGGTVTNDNWSEITELGNWQTTDSLRNKCCRAVGFIRVVYGADTGEASHEDPFFLVMNVVTPEVDSATPDMASDCEVLFVPRHCGGQASLLISDLPTTLAVHAFREFAADHSRWIQVCGCMNLYLCVMKCRLGPNAIRIPDPAMHAVFR